MKNLRCVQSGHGPGAQPLGPEYEYHVVVTHEVEGRTVLLAAIPYSVTYGSKPGVDSRDVHPGALSLRDAFDAGAALTKRIGELVKES